MAASLDTALRTCFSFSILCLLPDSWTPTHHIVTIALSFTTYTPRPGSMDLMLRVALLYTFPHLDPHIPFTTHNFISSFILLFPTCVPCLRCIETFAGRWPGRIPIPGMFVSTSDSRERRFVLSLYSFFPTSLHSFRHIRQEN